MISQILLRLTQHRPKSCERSSQAPLVQNSGPSWDDVHALVQVGWWAPTVWSVAGTSIIPLELYFCCYLFLLQKEMNTYPFLFNWRITALQYCVGFCHRASLEVQTVKSLPAMRETWVRALGWEDPLEEGMATHFRILSFFFFFFWSKKFNHFYRGMIHTQ